MHPTTAPWADPREPDRAGPPPGHNVPVVGPGVRRGASYLVMGAAAVALVATAASVWLYLLNRRSVEVGYIYGDALAGVLYPCVGAVLLWLDPRNRIGWIFAATGLLGLNALANQYAVTAHLVHPGLPLAAFAAWFAGWGWMPQLLVPALLPLLFPTGRLPSPRWRPVLLADVTLLAGLFLLLALTPHPIDASDRVLNPWAPVRATWARSLTTVVILGVLLLVVVGLVSLLVRMRRSAGVERRQIQWLVLGTVTTVILAVVAGLAPAWLDEPLWTLAVAAIPLAVLVGMVRHGLFDVQVVLNRTLVYALLTGVVVVGYLVAAAQLGEIAAQKLGVLAVALLALLLALARDRLQRAVDRALFGQRHDPYAVVDRVGQRIEAAPGPAEAVADSLDELRAALRLPSVDVLPDDPRLQRRSVGSPVAGTVDLPITAHGRRVAVLRVGLRHRGARFTAAERSVLDDAGRRVGALLQAAALVEDVRGSRERVVGAREEERRRLRHDLHDGVGPQLAGLALQLDSLGKRVAGDEENRARVQRLRDQLRDTVVVVRRLVDDLRPPALDDVGLLEALREQVRSFTGDAGPAVEVAGSPLPALPAAVEVAAYRIATEAVTNAVRHASPSRVGVQLAECDERLVVEVRDDGRGFSDEVRRGVGMTSMEERAAEVGGRLSVDTGPGGTTVRAELPVEGR
jgi:signal transduction histidine kinase